MSQSSLFALLTGVVALSASSALASSAEDAEIKKLLSMSLEELSNVVVTSVSKKTEPENEAAAAVFVVSQDDIRRSGATTIPEALRMVPGISVAQSGSNNWTVTSRGFNSQFANKLLVLMDGRTIYSPLFSGVIWDSQDVMMEDIERIEVIRGPGATLWGANAVNGVINIITKNSRDTQKGLASASIGNQMSGGAVRYGTKFGDDGYVRAYAKYNDYNSQFNTDGSDAGDTWRKQQAGFRSDMKISSKDKLTVQGDIYSVDEDDSFLFPNLSSGTYYDSSKGFKLSGGNILLHWEQKQSDLSETSVKAYFDNAASETLFFNDKANTADIEFQHVWTGWERQEFVWGGGYRFINDSNDPSTQYALTPKTRNDSLYNAFLQDKIALIPEKVFLTLGSKFEHNDYSGFEVQPSVRMSWLPSYTQTVWGAVSRAVHTPSRFDDNGRLSQLIVPPSVSLPIPTLVDSVANSDLESEKLISYELGYRFQPVKNLSVDLTGYYNDYSNLLTNSLGTPSVIGGTHVYQPLITGNSNEAHSLGFEAVARYDINSSWRLLGSYSYIDLVFDDKGKVGLYSLGKNPKHMFNLRSTYLFQNRVEMNNSLYTVSKLQSINVPSYYRFDTKFSYPLTDSVNISLVGQNLLDKRHKEFSPFLYQTQAEIGRSVYAGVSYKF
jgi:iron complex outermembrane receptor protein